MTEERLDELWKQVVHIGKVENLDYDAMIALGGVFGELSSEVRKQTERIQELEELLNTHAPHGRNYTNEQYVGLLQENEHLTNLLYPNLKEIKAEISD